VGQALCLFFDCPLRDALAVWGWMPHAVCVCVCACALPFHVVCVTHNRFGYYGYARCRVCDCGHCVAS